MPVTITVSAMRSDRCRTAESWSRPELESVGIDRFDWRRSQSWSRYNLAVSDFVPESQVNIRQQTIIWDERLWHPPENIERREENEGGSL